MLATLAALRNDDTRQATRGVELAGLAKSLVTVRITSAQHA